MYDETAAREPSCGQNRFLNVQTTFRHTFLYSELKCLPRGDPRNLCGNARIRLLATSGEMFQ